MHLRRGLLVDRFSLVAVATTKALHAALAVAFRTMQNEPKASNSFGNSFLLQVARVEGFSVRRLKLRLRQQERCTPPAVV
jgi:hypothetical protein